MNHRESRENSGHEVHRRTFLLQTGLAAGGLGLTAHPARGQEPSDPIPGGHEPGVARRDGHGGGGGGAVAQLEAQAPPFPFQGVTMPQRKSFYDYTTDDLNLLITAYGQLKQLPQNDPRSWFSQANIHASHCGGNLLEVHHGWFFTVWHRSYLFFYERILAKLSGNPAAFALPYWDWSNHPVVPGTRILQSQGQPSPFFDTTSPLYDENRFPGPTTSFSDDPLQTNVAYYTSTDYLSGIQADDFADFCGSVPGDPNGRGAGDLEQNPHNSVHTWTGTPQSPWADMGNLTTAARDLLFFLHHANVDRQFTLWLAQSPALPPPASSWYRQWFNFWDENGNACSVTVQDALTFMAGNYQPPQQTFILVNQPQELQVGGQPRSLTGVEVPDSLRKKAAAAAAAVASAAAQAPTTHRPKVQLRIEGLDAPHDVPIILHVFLNKPDATAKDVQGPNFVGTIHLLPSSAAHGQRHRPQNVTLDITRKAGLLGQDGQGKGPTVTFVSVNPRLDPKMEAPKVKFQKIVVVTRS